MKTSNKLLSSIIILIFLVTIAAFVDLRVFGTHRNERKTPKHEKAYQVGEFKHISFVQSFESKWTPSIRLVKSDSNYLKYTFYSDSLVQTFEHQIVRDTLFIKNLAENKYMYNFELFTNQQIASIQVQGTSMGLSGIIQDSLALNIRKGKIFNYSPKASMKVCKIGKLKIDQENGITELYNCSVDELDATLQESKLRINSDVAVINASLKNKSELSVKNISEIKLKKDNTSRFDVY